MGKRHIQLLTFEIDDRRFALPARMVREVIRLVAIAALPKAPPIVEGVINLRGTVVPVVNLRQRFGAPPRPLTSDQHLIVAGSGPRQVAIRVDRAVDFITVDASATMRTDDVAPAVGYARGLVRLPDGALAIHDLEAFLSLEEGQQVDSAMEYFTTAGPRVAAAVR